MKYIFVHIGKTGGASFRQLLSNKTKCHFGYRTPMERVSILDGVKSTNDNFTDSEINQLKSVTKNHDTFSAHMAYGLHNYIDDEYIYLSIIRHPVDRLISQFNYNVNNHKRFIDFVKNSQANRLINILYLSGLPCHDKWWVDNNYNSDYTVEKHINTALENISKDNFIFGLTDRYDEYLNILNGKTKWDLKKIHVNKAPKNKEITNLEIEEAHDICKDEIKFHEDVIKIYNQKYK